MRDIRFRAKRKYNGKWVYGSLVQTKNPHKVENEHWSTFIHEGPNISAPILVDPSTVGQFTGLKDKNGKEIYEGDRVSGDEGFSTLVSGIVKYNGMAFSFVGEGETGEPWYLSVTSDIDRCRFVEVIGNIHDTDQEK